MVVRNPDSVAATVEQPPDPVTGVSEASEMQVSGASEVPDASDESLSARVAVSPHGERAEDGDQSGR